MKSDTQPSAELSHSYGQEDALRTMADLLHALYRQIPGDKILEAKAARQSTWVVSATRQTDLFSEY